MNTYMNTYRNDKPTIEHSGKCDICGTTDNDPIYDARTRLGPWAWLCEACFERHTHKKLGLGFGQKYTKVKEK
jgi:hypothetical protein